jgi:pSer/pThr/pTyr-binding forkhead associated (FHA) protein
MAQLANGAGTWTDPGSREWLIDDEVTHLREWGTHRIHVLPADGEVTIGAAEDCELRLVDPTGRVSRRHACLFREQGRWVIRDLGSRNGTWLDGSRRFAFLLKPGAEVSFGRITLVAESPALVAVRGFLARLLGWSADRVATIDRALRALRMAATRRRALMVCGERDLVPIAHSLHRRTLGDGRPVVVCDPRRRSLAASVRATESLREGLAAMEAAPGGTLCVRARRLPPDFPEVSRALRDPSSRVQLVVCNLANPANFPVAASAGRRPDTVFLNHQQSFDIMQLQRKPIFPVIDEMQVKKIRFLQKTGKFPYTVYPEKKRFFVITVKETLQHPV